VDDGGGSGTECCGAEVRAERAKLMNMNIAQDLERDEIQFEKVRCS